MPGVDRDPSYTEPRTGLSRRFRSV